MITSVGNVHPDLMKAWQQIQENENSCLDKKEKIYGVPTIRQTLCQGLQHTCSHLIPQFSPNPSEVGAVPLYR